MRERLQRAAAALATPCVGTWPLAVPWVGVGLLAVAFAASQGVAFPHFHFMCGFSVGQLFTGISFAGFVGFQVAGALWSLLAANRRPGAGTVVADPTACTGIAPAIRPAFLATLQGTVAWLPVFLAPWFLGAVTFGVELRLLLVGALYALSARLVAAVVRTGVEAQVPPVLRLPGALLVTLVLLGGVALWPPTRLAGLAWLSPLGPVEALLLPVAQLLRALRHNYGSLLRVPVCAPLLPYLASHAALWLTCVLLIAVLRRWRPGLVRAARPPQPALVVLALALLATAAPARAWEGPLLLWYGVRFEADGGGSGAVSVLPLPPADTVLLLAEREISGRLVVSWRTDGDPVSDHPRLEVSRPLRLPAHQPVVLPVEFPESCQAFRAGLPAVCAEYEGHDHRNRLLAVELGSACAVRELSECQGYLRRPVILTLPFGELRPLLRTTPPPAILGTLEIAVLDVVEGAWKSALRDGLPPEAVPPPAVADPTETDDSAIPCTVVSSADGRRRAIVADWEGYAYMLRGMHYSTAGLLDAVDACAIVVRLPEARRFVQRPEGVVLVRAQSTAAPCQAWLLSVDAWIETPGMPPAKARGPPR